MLSEPLLPV